MSHKIDNPIWDAGYNAYFDLVPRDDNPHPEGSQEADDWDDGWDTADSDSDDGDVGGEG